VYLRCGRALYAERVADSSGAKRGRHYSTSGVEQCKRCVGLFSLFYLDKSILLGYANQYHAMVRYSASRAVEPLQAVA
jgi:hypothetical protein